MLDLYKRLLAVMFVLMALASDSQAKVCFATDPDCGMGVDFSDVTGADQNENACKDEGYTVENTCPSEKISYSCPYKSKWKMCCDKKYHYEGCIYPLENDGKCGTRYSCKCPDEYSLTADDVKNRNCQPGKYCILNDGVSETIKYSTCTCDRGVYTDETECTHNQTESGTCTNAEGKTYKKCYCDRSEGHFPHAACTYGPSIGARTCIDSSSGREYFSQCKTAEEACRTYDNDDSDDHDGKGGFQHTDCSNVHNCTTKESIWYEGSWQYLKSYNCILGEMCPYPTNPSLYKCVFDKASWCAGHDYKQSTSSKMSDGTTCTTPEGIQGKVENCPANDNAALYYYKCKISCDQRVLYVASGSGLNVEALGKTGHGIGGRFGSKQDASGVERPIAYWTYLSSPKNGFRKGYHLFLRGDVRLPDNGLAYNANNRDGDYGPEADANESNPVYQSINGISALYKLDPSIYSDCKDDYESMGKNPTLTIPLNGNYTRKWMFSRDFHNINIMLSRFDDSGTYQNWGNNTFPVDNQKDLGDNGNGEAEPVSTCLGKYKADCGYRNYQWALR